LLFVIIGLVQGIPSDKAIIGEVMPESAAEKAGIVAGDEIVQIDGNSISTWVDFTKEIQKRPEQQIDIVVDRGGQLESLILVTKQLTNEAGEKIGQAGVTLAFEKSFVKSFSFGFKQTYETTQIILQSLFMLVTGQYSLDMLAGP